MSHLKVTCHLASPLAGDAPRLDGLLEYILSLYHTKGQPGAKVDRSFPAPPQGEIPIPLMRRTLGAWLVGVCSDPIYPEPAREYADHFTRRIEPGNAGLLAPAEQRKIATSNTWTKSYRLPLRIRLIDRVVWFVESDRKRLLGVVRRCKFLGKKRSIGYGLVDRWDVEVIDDDYTWFAPTEDGPMLMATLPKGDWLPPNLIGYRDGFAGVCPPYWHPDRLGEVVTPC